MKQFVLSAFADEAGSEIETQISALERNHIGMIEIRNVGGSCILDLEREEIRRISALLVSHNIGVSAVASPIGKISVEDDFEAHKKRFEKALDTAEILGTDCIRIFSFYIPKGKSPADYKDIVLRRLCELADCAAKRCIYLCHENEKEIYGERPEELKILADAIENEYFTTVFDPANYIQSGADPMDAYQMTKRRIRYFHMKDAEKESGAIVPVGFGNGEIRSILQDAADCEYILKPVCLTLEPHLAVFDGYQNLGDNTVLGTKRFHYKDSQESFDAACNALKELLTKAELSF